jgi:hypothetical protein
MKITSANKKSKKKTYTHDTKTEKCVNRKPYICLFAVTENLQCLQDVNIEHVVPHLLLKVELMC